MQQELLQAKDAVVSILRGIGPELLESYGDVAGTMKQDKSVVTYLDGWAESEIQEGLLRFDRSIGFLGEENGAIGNTQKRWLIDPVDGTEQFIRGIPFCGNMITLVDGKQLLVSVIYNFVTGDIYWAVKGGGAWKNDKQLRVSERPLDRSMVEVSVDFKKPTELDLFLKLAQSIKTPTRFNCSAFTSTMIGQGSIEGRVVFSGKGGPWDYAPGVLLATEAGGVAVHSDGSDYDYERTSDVLVGTQPVVEFVLSHLASN